MASEVHLSDDSTVSAVSAVGPMPTMARTVTGPVTMRRRWQTFPPALALGLLLSLLVGVAYDPFEPSTDTAWRLLETGLAITTSGLLAAGWHELSTRFVGKRRTALRIAAAMAALQGLRLLLIQLPMLASYDAERIVQIYQSMAMLGSAAWFVGTVAVGVAADAWQRARRRTSIYAGAAMFLVALQLGVLHQLLPLGTWRIAFVVALLAYLAMLALFARDLDRASHPPAPDPAVARRGLQHAAAAIWLRILCAVAYPLIFVISSHSPGSLGYVLFGASVVGAATMLWFVVGILTAARSRLPGLSPVALVLAGAGILWYAGIQLVQFSMTLSQSAVYSGSYRQMLDAWSTVGPAITLVAAWVIIRSMARMAGERGDLQLEETLRARGIVFALLAGGGLVILLQAHKASTFSGILLIVLASAAASVAHYLLAQSCSLAARSIRDEALPAAKALRR